MPETIAILGASGKLGGATLSALLAHNLAPARSIVALTSSQPGSEKWAALAARFEGVEVRHARFEDGGTLERALRGVHTFFLVSTPDIALDFADDQGNPLGPGRDAHHRVAIDAARRAGVRRLVYSSLAFAFAGTSDPVGGESKAGVMRAHLRTEAYLRQVRASEAAGAALSEIVAVREGLYSESWPLYLGYFARTGADDDRTTVRLAGDGGVCWTAIPDLGIANAIILTAPTGTYEGYWAFYLSTRPAAAKTMREVAALVAEARGKEVAVEIVGAQEHVRHYVEDRGLPAPAVRWWVSTYVALEDGECVVDDPTLEELLARVGKTPTPFEDTVKTMVKRCT